ncbi:MAG: hypothetical protein ACP5D9_04060 [Mariniphaga sp.]
MKSKWRNRYNSLFLVFSLGLLLGSVFSLDAQEKASIHCLGNGNYGVYASGVNIQQVFGPPYSTPSFFSSTLNSSNIQVETNREPGTDIYVHTFYKDGKKTGTITDVVPSDINCFCRISDLTEPVYFNLLVENPRNSVSLTDYPRHVTDFGINNSLLVSALPGVFVYNDYPAPFEINHQIITNGSVRIYPNAGNKWEYIVEFGEGKGVLYFVGGPSFQELNSNLEKALNQSKGELLSNTRANWRNYTEQGFDFAKEFSCENRDKPELLNAVDDVSVLLRTQQGEPGGVLAGHYYHMAYVRDEYGVSRAFLALGYYGQARKILDFYFDVWSKFGVIHNAQAIGIPGIFHKHENDEVEITGYLLIQAFDYLKKTNDKAFVKKIMPLLEWSWEVQKKNLVDNMLPFNGDETYIAGGLIPRKVLNDGSAEATLLFIEGGARLLRFIEQEQLKGSDWLTENNNLLDQVKSDFRRNFMNDNRLMANNPLRAEHCEYPEYRYGVCLYPRHGGYRGILRHHKGSLYFCKECFGKANDKIEPERAEEFFLPSVYLMPIYLDADLFSEEEKKAMLNELVALYWQNGRITIAQQDEKLLGYDYGLFLYALTEFNHPLAKEIYRKMMDLPDETGTWCEYYLNGVPNGCRYRPWESGINIEAAIKYVRKNDVTEK